MMYETGDKKLENAVTEGAECCDSPEIQFSDWKWDKANHCWRFDGLCYNCWETCYGKIHAVDVEFDG